MDEHDKREVARRMNEATYYAFDAYLRGVRSFEECAVIAIERLREQVESLEMDLASYGG